MMRQRALAYVAAAATCVVVAHGVAKADSVAFTRVEGRAPRARLDHVGEQLASAARAGGHEVIALPPRTAAPSTAAEMGAAAEASGAAYVVAAEVTPLAGQYRLLLRVGYAPQARVEEIEVNVLDAQEELRLRDILAAMLRPEGLGEDAVRLAAGASGAATSEPSASEREQREREAEAHAERERQEREQREERARLARAAAERSAASWAARPRYGDDASHPWLGQAGLGVQVLAARGDESRGSTVLVTTRLAVGRALDAVRGLEVRGSLDLVLGGTSGFALTAVTAASGALGIGASLRVGYRF